MKPDIDVVAAVKSGISRGRPNKSVDAAAAEAANIFQIGSMLRQGRLAELKVRGFTEAAALRYVLKRRRGLTGDYVGSSVRESLAGIENRTQAALRLITEHSVGVSTAARLLKLDKRTLSRQVPAARKIAKAAHQRAAEFAKRTTVWDANIPNQNGNTGAGTIFLPQNPPA